jgi:hypothetical protein
MVLALILFVSSKTWFVESPCTDCPDSEKVTLQETIDKSRNGDVILIKPGRYEATPKPYVEKICGNCENPITDVKATVGFHVKEKTLVIIGQDKDSTILITNSGYGVLLENSYGSLITNLTVTGGVRDHDWKATDAGVVGKNCRVTVENIRIINNTNQVDTVTVGISGVMGREGAELYIIGNEIANNTWDGIALYRGASAVITDNIIENGGGAGIGITWDASAQVYKNNAVYNNSGWGIIATGNAFMEVLNNLIYHNCNCGFAAWEVTAKGLLKNNIIVQNGWKEEWVCPRVGVWMNTSIENFPIEINNIWNNEEGNFKGIDDQTGISGNISADPLFKDLESFILKPDSPCIDVGDSTLIDRYGSISDMGIYGGPLSIYVTNM